MISYEKLVIKLKESGYTEYKLKKDKILGSATSLKIFADNGKSGQSVDIKVIDRMCELFHCRVEDIIEYIPSEGNKR